jgi:hypothetical protein
MFGDEDDTTEPGLRAFEAALGGLVPAGGRIDRDRVMYRAGQAAAAAGPFARVWAPLSGVLGLLLVVQTVAFWRPEGAGPAAGVAPAVVVTPPQPADAGTELVAERPAPVVDPFLDVRTPHDRLAWQLLHHGLDALPPPRGVVPSRAETSAEELLDELITSTPDPRRPS